MRKEGSVLVMKLLSDLLDQEYLMSVCVVPRYEGLV